LTTPCHSSPGPGRTWPPSCPPPSWTRTARRSPAPRWRSHGTT